MADTIGPVALNRVHGYSEDVRSRVIRVRGDMASQAAMTQLEELFAKTGGGSTVHRVPGALYGEDNTEELRNTHYCGWDDGSMKDGWYLLRGLTREEDGPVFWIFTAELFYLGSASKWQPGFRDKGHEDVSNDWSLD